MSRVVHVVSDDSPTDKVKEHGKERLNHGVYEVRHTVKPSPLSFGKQQGEFKHRDA